MLSILRPRFEGLIHTELASCHRRSRLCPNSTRQHSLSYRFHFHPPLLGFNFVEKSKLICRDSPKQESPQIEPRRFKGSEISKYAAVLVGVAALVYLLSENLVQEELKNSFLASTKVGLSFIDSIRTSWLGHSGFIAALCLIFLSEIGDKTFFICAILAMRLGRLVSFLGTVLALGVMTLLSVGLGVAFRAMPDPMKTTLPVGKYLSVALLFFFGIRSILSGTSAGSSADDELADAEETVSQRKDFSSDEQATGFSRFWKSIFVVFALIFVAEWGDRSMLTTIALGASANALGVALGGILGHVLAALIAVFGGSLISQFISERTVNIISGVLFVVFAVSTALNLM